MKKLILFAFSLLACVAPSLAVPGAEFNVKKVEFSTPSSPDFGNSDVKWSAQKWIRVDTTFEAAPDYTDELVFTYYVLFGDRLLVGHVNHVNIAAGRDLHSAMYISPKAMERLMMKKQMMVNMQALPIKQVTVVITKPGVMQPLAVGNLKQGIDPGWWAAMKQEEGFLLNKSETPFAPLFWDYYEAIKSNSGR